MGQQKDLTKEEPKEQNREIIQVLVVVDVAIATYLVRGNEVRRHCVE